MLNTFVLFLLAFDPQIPFFPNGVGFSFLIFWLLLIPTIVKIGGGQVGHILFWARNLFFLFAFAFAVILIRVIANGGVGIEFVLSFFKAFFVFGSILFYVIIFCQHGMSGEFISRLSFVYVLNALINFFSGTYPEIFNFLEVFRSKAISDTLGVNPYRNSFVSGSGYFSIGTAYGLVVLLVAFHVANSKVKWWRYATSLVVISIAAVVAARTAFFAVISAFFYMFINRGLYFVCLVFFSFVVVFFVFFISPLQSYALWIQSFFVDFESSSSASHLFSEMYFWPGINIFIFGAGVVNDGDLAYTDAGYMKDILFGGLFFLLVKLFFVVVFFIAAFRFSILFGVLFCSSVLVFHIKGLFLYNNAQGKL